MEFTVLEFKFIEFAKNWNYVVFDNMGYEAQDDPSLLLVVAEDFTGAKTTYWFKLPKASIVQVSKQHNLVYIPGRCYKKEKGDATQCGK
jgi:hypothetical protein